jgi:hypothetical protein
LGSRVNIIKLPPVSTTPAVLVAKFATSVVDTGGKFAAGVVDLQISPRISFEMTLMIFSGASGKMIYERKLKQKIS